MENAVKNQDTALSADDAGAVAATDLMRNSTPQMSSYGYGYGGSNRGRIAAVAIAIIIIAVVAYLAIGYKGSVQPAASTASASVNSTTASITAAQNTSYINATLKINDFLGAYGFSFGNNQTGALPPYYNQECHYTSYSRAFAYDVPIQPAPVNYSSLNQSRQFFVYLVIKIINSSNLAAFTQEYAANKGYCNNATAVLAANSDFASYNQSYGSSAGYLLQFTNFTSKGLNSSDIFYTGHRPDISLLESAVIYRNAEVSVQSWGFQGHMNRSMVISETNTLLESFEKAFPG